MKNLKKATVVLCLLILFLTVFSSAQAADAPVKSSLKAHFIDNGDGTVTDKRNGLVWKKCVEGINGHGCANGTAEKFKWQNAVDHVKAINDGDGFAGKKDWRIPTREEIESLISKINKDPAIDVEAFPNTPFDTLYWSSTFTDDGKNVSAVIFSIGKRLWTFKFDVGYLRLVRGGEKKEEKKEKVKPKASKKTESKTDVKKESEVKAPEAKAPEAASPEVKTPETKTP